MDVQKQTRGVDGRIAALVERQHGVVARWQLRALGLGREAVEVRLRVGRLHPIHAGVYAVGHPRVTRSGRWMAAVLFCGPAALLSHRAGAALWGLAPVSGGAIDVTVPAKSRSTAAIARHFSVVPADEATIRDGIPVTTVPRTIFDLAAVEPIDRVERALRDVERLRLHDRLSLEELLERHPRRRGASAIRECLRRRRDLPGGFSREELEARFVAFLDREGLPRPHLNAWIELEGRFYRPDCLWPDRRLVVELDGFRSHGTRSAFERDRDRDRRLAAAGYRSIRITWRQLHDEPAAIARDLRTVLIHGRDYERT